MVFFCLNVFFESFCLIKYAPKTLTCPNHISHIVFDYVLRRLLLVENKKLVWFPCEVGKLLCGPLGTLKNVPQLDMLRDMSKAPPLQNHQHGPTRAS